MFLSSEDRSIIPHLSMYLIRV